MAVKDIEGSLKSQTTSSLASSQEAPTERMTVLFLPSSPILSASEWISCLSKSSKK